MKFYRKKDNGKLNIKVGKDNIQKNKKIIYRIFS